jgi:hypothetical protein
VFIGPLTVPDLPRKRRWGWLLVWTLLVFAGGVAAGPALIDQAFMLVERASSMLGMAPPQFVEKLKPAGPSIEPLSAPGVEQAPAGEGQVELAPTTAEPVARQAEKPAESDKPAGTVPQPRRSLRSPLWWHCRSRLQLTRRARQGPRPVGPRPQ